MDFRSDSIDLDHCLLTDFKDYQEAFSFLCCYCGGDGGGDDHDHDVDESCGGNDLIPG